MSSRNLAIVKVTADFLVECMKDGGGRPRAFRVVENPLPDDAKIVHMGYNDLGQIYLVVESRMFAPVQENERPPELPRTTMETVVPKVSWGLPEYGLVPA